MEQLALKILANATSYGIFIELNVEDTDQEDPAFRIYTFQESRTVSGRKREQPGRYYHPLLGTLITGAARLMLALTERLAIDNGLSWAFCDTDSMAFANTGRLPFKRFVHRVERVCKWFEPLNPYERSTAQKPISILEMEDQNFSSTGEKKLEPLYCFAISAKRYALFNWDQEGRPIIRKASAHGLGHFLAPYGDEGEDRSERDTGVRPWEEDVWNQIIISANGRTPRHVSYDYRPEMSEPAVSRYGATRPATHGWFKRYNQKRGSFADSVKPFNFMLSYYARQREDLIADGLDAEDVPSLDDVRPVAPFDRDRTRALEKVFDRASPDLRPVPGVWLRAVSDVLRHYHLQPEYKFHGGGWTEAGVLTRRHIQVTYVEDIGEESEGWEEDDANALDEPTTISYGSSADDIERMRELIMSVPKPQLAKAAHIARRTIDAVHAGNKAVSERDLKRMAAAAEVILAKKQAADADREAALRWMRLSVEEKGLAGLVDTLGYDKSNIAKMLIGRRRIPDSLVREILITSNMPT